jgi:hypothetical protein
MSVIKNVTEGTWVVQETTALRELTIAEGASVAAPEGKALTLTVNGTGTTIAPGTYKGDIVLSVSDFYPMAPSGLFRNMAQPANYPAAIVIKDGKVVKEQCVPAIVQGGTVTDNLISGVTIYDTQESFNGIVVDGDSEVKIEHIRMDVEGAGGNDFMAMGAGVTCVGNAKVVMDDCDINFAGITRCAVHFGGDADVTVNNCHIVNTSPATDRMQPAWMLGLRGTNRALQLCDNATVRYNNCYLRSNGWGVFSIDGVIHNRLYIKDSTIEHNGARARGYGAFSIGDSFISFDNCKVFSVGYPILMNTEDGGGAEYVNGTVVKGTLYGAMIFRDHNGHFTVKDSTVDTVRSTFVVKGANTNIHLNNANIKAENGVILQLMDNDDPGHSTFFAPPIGEVDIYVEGRDLTVAQAEEDVFMDITDCEISGDFLNSSTNLKANLRSDHIAHFEIGLKGEGLTETLVESRQNAAEEDEDHSLMEDPGALQGPKNLELKLANAKVNGVISSATQRYYDGVTRIDASNSEELSNVIQTPAPTVNNGVILELDGKSVWTVTGTSYITKLVLAEGAAVKAAAGKTLSVTVDGAPVSLAAGTYTGKIVVDVK